MVNRTAAAALVVALALSGCAEVGRWLHGPVEPVGLDPVAVLPTGDTEAPNRPTPGTSGRVGPSDWAEPADPTPSVTPSAVAGIASPAVGTSTPTPTATPPPAPVLLVVDAAVAMDDPFGGESRREAVATAVARVVADAPPELPLGLAVTGDGGDATPAGRQESCSSVRTIARPGELTGDTVAARVTALPATGWRPLAAAVQVGIPILRGAVAAATSDAPRMVLVVSGADSCDRDPVDELVAAPEVVVDVIGLAVDPVDAGRLADLAAAADGHYTDVDDRASLVAALGDAIGGGPR